MLFRAQIWPVGI